MTRFLKAAAALVALAALVVIPPWVLLTYVGNPWPAGGMSWDQPLSDEALIGVIAAAVWVLWAQLMICLVVEVVAVVTRDAAQWRAPLTLGVQQQLVRRLVTAVVFTGVAAPLTAGTAFAAPAPAPATSPVAIQADTAAAVADVSAEQQQEQVAEQDHVETSTITVRQGDSLWALAEEHLGDGQQWRQIADLNEGHTMSDGRVFRSTGALQPGWQLTVPVAEIPAATQAPSTAVVEAGDTLSGIALEQLGDADRYPEIFQASRDITQPGGEQLVDPDHIEPGWTVQIPAGAPPASTTPERSPKTEAEAEVEQTPAPATPPPAVPQTPQAQEPTAQADDATEQSAAAVDQEEGQQWPIRTVGGIGALLAAALIALIGARRARQGRRRRPGEELPLPSTEAESTEATVRAVADPLTLGIVDEALCSLASARLQQGAPVPELWAVRMSTEHLDVYLHAPADLPAPWVGTDNPAVWTLPAAAVGDLPPAHGLGRRPYPALVSVGHDSTDAVILINLAQVQELAISGDQANRAQTAVMLELGSIEWAESVVLTVVGGHRELVDVLEPGRARYVPSLNQVDEISDRTQVVITAQPPTESERDLVRATSAAALVHLGTPARDDGWCLDVTDVDHALLQPIGLQLAPQVVDEGTYRHLVEVLETTQEDPAPRPALSVVEDEEDEEDVDDHEGEDRDEDREEGPVEGPVEPIGREEEEEPPVPAAAEPPETEGEMSQDETSESVDTPEQDVDADQPAAAEAPAEQHEGSGRASLRVHERLQTGHPAIRVLGPSVDLIGATGKPPATQTHQRLCTRIATYLAFHPGTSRAVLVDAVWNGQRVAGSTVDSRISQLRRWLGTNPTTGEQYLPPRTLDLAKEITTDWDEFNNLAGDPQAAATGNLEDSLELVRGRPLEAEDSKHWAWLEYDLLRIGTTLSDTCYELAHRRYMDGSWSKAAEAAELGILLDPGNEYLWRLRIHTAHAAGNPAHAEQAIGRMLTRLQTDLGCAPEPETMDLVKAVRSHDSDAVAKAAGEL